VGGAEPSSGGGSEGRPSGNPAGVDDGDRFP